MTISRRKFLVSAAAIGGVALTAGLSGRLFDLFTAADAQDVPLAELMKPGPLGDQGMGDPKAPVTIIEYASMTCGHCAHFAVTTFPELKKRYIDTGKVYFILREFPLDNLAAAGFVLARCQNDKFFPLVETLFANQKDWVVQEPLQPLLKIAKGAGFTDQSFNQCIANQKILDGVEEVRNRAARQFGVQSTPTFFINGKRETGAFSIEEMDKLIKPYLKDS